MRPPTAVYVNDAPGLPYVVARARRICQLCGDGGARPCAARKLRGQDGGPGPWWVAMLCGECTADMRADRSVVVLAEVTC